MKIKHEFKIPKFFKEKVENAKERMEEVEEDFKRVSTTALLIGVPLAAGLTLGYLVGFNKGLLKTTATYIIK